jgi:prolycopene isomerase
VKKINELLNSKKLDVVVIGAGLSGLSVAAYLAKAGKQVLILEHHDVPGGYAHAFHRGQFKFDVSLHAINGVAPGGGVYETLAELGVLTQLKFHRFDPFYGAKFPEHEIAVPADITTYQDSLCRHFPDEKEGLQKLFTDIKHITEETSNILGFLSQTTWSDYLNKHIHNPKLKGIISVLWNYIGLPSSQLNAAFFLYLLNAYILHGAYYPEGGSMAISHALESIVNRFNGKIIYNQTVKSINIHNGQVVSVTTQDSLTVKCHTVISAASASDTILKIVGRKYFGKEYLQKIERRKPSISSFILYLGINRDQLKTDWKHHVYFLCNTYDVEQSFQYAKTGQFDKSDIFISHHYSHKDWTRASGNYSTLTIMTFACDDYADYWGTGGHYTNYRKNPRYHEIKKKVANILIERVEQVVPGLRTAIVHKNIATPLTNIRYTLNPRGSIYGSGERSANDLFNDPLGFQTPISNLFLTGAWVTGCGMSSAIWSGKMASREIMAYLNKQ